MSDEKKSDVLDTPDPEGEALPKDPEEAVSTPEPDIPPDTFPESSTTDQNIIDTAPAETVQEQDVIELESNEEQAEEMPEDDLPSEEDEDLPLPADDETDPQEGDSEAGPEPIDEQESLEKENQTDDELDAEETIEGTTEDKPNPEEEDSPPLSADDETALEKDDFEEEPADDGLESVEMDGQGEDESQATDDTIDTPEGDTETEPETLEEEQTDDDQPEPSETQEQAEDEPQATDDTTDTQEGDTETEPETADEEQTDDDQPEPSETQEHAEDEPQSTDDTIDTQEGDAGTESESVDEEQTDDDQPEPSETQEQAEDEPQSTDDTIDTQEGDAETESETVEEEQSNDNQPEPSEIEEQAEDEPQSTDDTIDTPEGDTETEPETLEEEQTDDDQPEPSETQEQAEDELGTEENGEGESQRTDNDADTQEDAPEEESEPVNEVQATAEDQPPPELAGDTDTQNDDVAEGPGKNKAPDEELHKPHSETQHTTIKEKSKKEQVIQFAKWGAIIGIPLLTAVLLFIFKPAFITSLFLKPELPLHTPETAAIQWTAEELEMINIVGQTLTETEKVWSTIFTEKGGLYRKPDFTIFTNKIDAVCIRKTEDGQIIDEAFMGSFYCPQERRIYIDLALQRDLKNRLDIPGDFAQAYVVAHEIGHHVQNLAGISEQIPAARLELKEKEFEKVIQRMELQADCFAGIWARHTAKEEYNVNPDEFADTLNGVSQYAQAHFKERATGVVMPDQFTHAPLRVRLRWFSVGFDKGTFDACDTFTTQEL